MNQRKKNRTPWLAAALLPILLLGLLIASTGGALARYRYQLDPKDRPTIDFEVRPPDQVVLGKMVAEGESVAFDPNAQGVWETVEGTQQLTFTIANGTAADDFSRENQRISLRLIGTLGIWDGIDENFEAFLQLPPEADAGEEAQPEKIQAKVTRIQKGSPMHTTFGDGWVIAFLDEEKEEELSWLLEGGELNTITMTLILEGVAENATSMMQLQISGVYSEK